jgi:hypothetical protein
MEKIKRFLKLYKSCVYNGASNILKKFLDSDHWIGRKYMDPGTDQFITGFISLCSSLWTFVKGAFKLAIGSFCLYVYIMFIVCTPVIAIPVTIYAYFFDERIIK